MRAELHKEKTLNSGQYRTEFDFPVSAHLMRRQLFQTLMQILVDMTSLDNIYEYGTGREQPPSDPGLWNKRKLNVHSLKTIKFNSKKKSEFFSQFNRSPCKKARINKLKNSGPGSDLFEKKRHFYAHK